MAQENQFPWPRRRRRRRSLTWHFVDSAALAATALLWLVSLSNLADGLDWRFDLLAHWRPLYLLGFLGLLLFWLLRRRLLWLLPAAGGVLFQLSAVGPYLATTPAAAAADHGFTLLTFNAFVINPDPAQVADLLQAENPDLVVLQEATPRLAAAIAEAAATYPYAHFDERIGTRGTIVLSRLPLTFLGEGNGGTWSRFLLQEERRPIDLFVVHTRAPRSAAAVALRNQELAALARATAAAENGVLVAGDLNTSPWTDAFQGLLAAGNLQDGRRGRALAATWPAPAGGLGTPIDHVLVSPELAVTALRAGPGSGSDHRPVLATIGRRSR